MTKCGGTFDLVVLGGGIVGIWTALRAEAAGLRVAIVERGPGSLRAQRPASPRLCFPERENVGATKARNHVLTGNSAYWGGGLARNPLAMLQNMFGEMDGKRIADEYDRVERALGVGPPTPGSEQTQWGALPLQEVVVLPGKRRGLWSTFQEAAERRQRISVFTDAEIRCLRLSPDLLANKIVLSTSSAGPIELRPKAVSLSMGVIDSVVFVERFLSPEFDEHTRELVGRHLHDHWSVPVAKIRWKNSASMRPLFPPKFRRRCIVGRRISGEKGFFHVTADYDQLEPYSAIKAYLAARQQGGGLPECLFQGVMAFKRPDRLLGAAAGYLLRGELRVPDGEEVRLVLDFESTGGAENRLRPSVDGEEMYWDVRDADQDRFVQIMTSARPGLEAALVNAGAEWSWLPNSMRDADLARHLKSRAVDAYHLGGGLQCFPGEAGVTDRRGYIRTASNVFVNSTAAFCRPGTANPVLTLLARAGCYVDSLAAGAA